MNELVRVEQPSADVRAYRASTEAADICKEIVLAASSVIQGRKFVSVEGWQAIAVAHGCVLSARDVEQITGGVRAIGEVRRMSDGQLIATGEGFVGEDEPTWFGGQMRGKTLPKRNDYAIRAMAQTRAMSRAGRTAFAHVVVMMKAGLATTPAEEMVYADAETGEVFETGEREMTERVPGITKIKNNLNKLMRDGRKATSLEAFNDLVHGCRDDLQAIKDANHSYWTGDGEDHEGLKAWIKRRREELTPVPETLEYQMLCSLVNESTTSAELASLVTTHGDAIGELDGEESRKFEALYDARTEALKAPETDDMTRAYTKEELRQAACGKLTPMTAGTFGG